LRKTPFPAEKLAKTAKNSDHKSKHWTPDAKHVARNRPLPFHTLSQIKRCWTSLSATTAAGRVSRWVSDKIAQNVAQPVFSSRLLHSLHRGKSSPKMWATSVIFKKSDQSRPSPNFRKLAQSGHSCSCFGQSVSGEAKPQPPHIFSTHNKVSSSTSKGLLG
jgi:hypothetical protein